MGDNAELSITWRRRFTPVQLSFIGKIVPRGSAWDRLADRSISGRWAPTR